MSEAKQNSQKHETATEGKLWPSDWPQYKQSCFASFDDRCDVIEGLCSCGAWHSSDEFELIAGKLHRYGQPTSPYNAMCSKSQKRDGA